MEQLFGIMVFDKKNPLKEETMLQTRVDSIVMIYNNLYPNYTANEKLRELDHSVRYDGRNRKKRSQEESYRQNDYEKKLLDVYI